MQHSIQSVIPKLPSTNLLATRDFYIQKLGFRQVGLLYPDYLMLQRDDIELHFFLFSELNVLENYGMCYLRVKNIQNLYEELKAFFPDLKKPVVKPWGQIEFYLNDEDHNSLSFGERG